MKILSIGTDRKIFEEGSAVRARMIEYGEKMEELHIVVFSGKLPRLQATRYKLSPHVWAYPTNSLSRWFYIFDAIRIGKRIIHISCLKSPISVITSQDPFECGCVGYRLARAFNLPLHLQIHTDFLSPYFKTSLLQRIRVRIARFLLPHADGVRVVSKRIVDSMTDHHIKLKRPPQILPIRIDAESISNTAATVDVHTLLPHTTCIVLMVSRLTKEKRITDALTSFASVLAQYPTAGLIIAGEGPEKNHLEAYVHTLGISDNVRFLPFQHNLPTLLKSADIFLSTSEYEGYGMSIIEAGLAHCPVVVSDVGVSGEVLKDGLNASICPVGDTACFASHIAKLVNDSALRGTLAGRLESDVRSHLISKEEYIAQFVRGLEETIKNKE